MDNERVKEIKSNLDSKETNDLLEIWKKNDRTTYADEAFEAIKQILAERNVSLPPQSAHIPPEDRPEHFQWNTDQIKRKRIIYLSFFLLMIIASVWGVLQNSAIIISGNFVFGAAFLLIFLHVTRVVLHYSPGARIVLAIVILCIPGISLIAIAIEDRRVYNALKKRKLMENK